MRLAIRLPDRLAGEPHQVSILYGCIIGSAASFVFGASFAFWLTSHPYIWRLVGTEWLASAVLGLVALRLTQLVQIDPRKMDAVALGCLAMLMVPLPATVMAGVLSTDQVLNLIGLYVVVASAALLSRGAIGALWIGAMTFGRFIVVEQGGATAPLVSRLVIWAVTSVASAVVFTMSVAYEDLATQLGQEALALTRLDQLTGLTNRAGFGSLALQPYAIAHRRRQQVWVGFIDIDGFKAVNDRLGHRAGDQVLTAVGAAIGNSQRAADLTARWGGDEFVIIGVGEPPDSDALEERIISNMHGLSESVLDVWTPSVTVGIAMQVPTDAREPAESVTELVEQADLAMYERRKQLSRTSR